MLRDRIVCRINDDVIYKRLLFELELNYAKEVETATNMEMELQSVKELKDKPDMYVNNTSTVHKMSTTPSPEQGVVSEVGVTCFCCGIGRAHSLQVPDRQKCGFVTTVAK